MSDFRTQVALVTGASRGIGASVARMLASGGADVVINYRSKGSRAEEVANAIAPLVATPSLLKRSRRHSTREWGNNLRRKH